MRGFDACIPAAFKTNAKSSHKSRFVEAIHALEVADQKEAPCLRNVFPYLLQWCIDRKIVRLGRQVHCLAVKRRAECEAILASYLVRMYAACGNLEDAYTVFKSLPNPDIYLWSAIILAHANAGQGGKAIQLYQSMLEGQKLRPDAHIFVAVLKACASTCALSEGKLVHANSIEIGVELILHVGNILIDMYVRCRCLADAQAVFDRMPKKDVITWNALIAGYSSSGHGDKVHELCQKMQKMGIEPDNVTFLSLVGAASASLDLEPELASWKLEYVSELFEKLPNRSLAAWSAMIAAYAEHGDQGRAVRLYLDLLQEGLKPDVVTFVCVLKACSNLDMAKCIHFHIIESGCEIDLQVGNCLIDLYGCGGGLEDARILFDTVHSRCVVTWSTMISAYLHYERDQDALELFSRMLQGGTKPNEVTYFFAMKSCVNMTALVFGLLIYTHIVESGFDLHVQVKNAAIDMFAKCGSLQDACSVFQGMPKHSVITWSAMISAYVRHGQHESSLECFSGMLQEGVEPNTVTYICLLSSCHHLGLVNQGSHHLHMMEKIFGIKPTLEHRNCLVELYGRAGQLKEAADLLEGVPDELDIVAWMSLLNQCKAHGNIDLARKCFNSIIMMEPKEHMRQLTTFEYRQCE